VARRKGFLAAMAQANREHERQRNAQMRAAAAAQRDVERAMAVAQRDAEREMAASQRASVAEQREAKRRYVEAREAEVAALNADASRRRTSVETILAASLSVDPYIDLDSLKQPVPRPTFDPAGLDRPAPKPDENEYLPPPLSGAQRFMPGAKGRHELHVEERRQKFREALLSWESLEKTRLRRLEAAREVHEEAAQKAREDAEAQNAEIELLRTDLDSGSPDAVRSYVALVLGGSAWPDGFPQTFALAYDPASKLAVVDYRLPDWSIIPEAKAYRYVKADDRIEPVAETASKRRSLYASVVAQSALRILREAFMSDRAGFIETMALNCLVDTVDRATGTRIIPCILSVRTTASVFKQINLSAVEPTACLKGLSAAVSPRPSELAPVRPVVELKMVDPRFVTETDVLSELDQRPNLMELSPTEFESLITNLFTKMGLETRLTQASRDGGVDCVAFDPRPIFGGKVVIQAKRYKNTVGVSAVRDLFGTMQNEGASKGILVTTSGYGSASFAFADGKPLELLSGANLLYLLAEHAGIEARIVVPEEWKDPNPDDGE
jgi:restriction system protein